MRLRTPLLIGVVVLLGVALLPGPRNAAQAAQAAQGDCPPPPAPQRMVNPAFYRYVQTYDSACASRWNWDRTFDDSTVSRTVDGVNRLAVTASAALGGALASLRVNDKEFLASGGHGASLQWAFHAWNGGGATECYNPTQGGSRPDDAGPPPYHGPSTSALYEQTASGASLRTTSRLAMYVPLSMTTPGYGGCQARDYQPDRSPYTFGLSPYWLNTTVRLAPDHGLSNLDNVVQLTAQLTSEDVRYAHFDGVLVAYLQRDFTRTFAYDPATRTLTGRSGDFASSVPVLRCTPNLLYCVGAYFRRSAMPTAYYWIQTDGPSDYNGLSGAFVEQVTVPATNVGAGGLTRLDYEVYLAVGDLARVRSTLDALASQVPAADIAAVATMSAGSPWTPTATESDTTTGRTSGMATRTAGTTARVEAAPMVAVLTTRPPSGQSQLPLTGASAFPLVLTIAAGLLAMGGSAVFIARRRLPAGDRTRSRAGKSARLDSWPARRAG